MGRVLMLLCLLGLAIPLGGCAATVPPQIVAIQKQAGAGRVVVVEFVDFECPFCRALHQRLSAVLEPHHKSVVVVRKHVPLPQHPAARGAARAAICGEKLGKADAIADAIATAPVWELGTASYRAMATALGLDRAAFDSCLGAAETNARIDDDIALFKQMGGRSVPQLWIGDAHFRGVAAAEQLQQALDEALSARPN